MSDPLSLPILFATAGNFTYDSALVEFLSNTARLKNQTPSNVTFAATYTSSINGSLGSGVLTGTAINSAGVSGGKLDLRASTVKYVTYAAALNAAFTTTGAVRFKYTPNYSGMPAANYGIISFIPGDGTLKNMLQLNQISDGNIEVSIFSASGGTLQNGGIGVWSPVSGTEYEFLLVLDIVTGATKVFINGVQFGSTIAATGTRIAAVTMQVGTNYNHTYVSNGQVRDVVVYSVAPYTADYISGYTVPESKYSMANPSVLLNSGTQMDGISDFSSVFSASGSDTVKYTLLFDGVEYYVTGGVVTASNSTYAQSSSEAEIFAAVDAITTALTGGALVKLKAYLHAADGSTTPILTNAEIEYSYFIPQDSRDRCIVSCYAADFLDADATDVSVIVEVKKAFFSGDTLIKAGRQSFLVDSNGYFEEQFVSSEDAGRLYYFSIEYTDNNIVKNKKLGSCVIPNDTSAALSTLLTL
jgi:hypothetical protein